MAGDARVVEQQVKPAVSASRFLEKVAHGVGIGDVRRYDQRLGTILTYFKCGNFQGLLASARKNHRVAIMSESNGNVLANPAARARDNSNLGRCAHAFN